MSYIGAQPTTASFPFDQFSGNGSTTAFTLTYAPASTSSIIVAVSGVVQNPNTYSCIGTTLTFTGAPPTGTNNISVLYLGLPVIGVSSPGNTAYFSSTSFTATASQTTFTPSGSYQVGFINVIRNGSQLAPADYTATNGTTVVLNNACTAGDIVVIEVYTLTSISNALPLTGGTVTGASTFNSTLTVNGAAVSGFTGFKNRIINPGMVIDQRNAGASLSSGTGAIVYTVDRWFIFATGAAVTTQRVSGTAPHQYACRLTGASSNTLIQFVQRIESLNCYDLANQTITLSCTLKASTNVTVNVYLANATGGVDNYSTANTFASTAFSVTTTAQTFTFSTTAAAGVTNGFYVMFAFNSGLGAGVTFDITGVQLERGSNATSFEFRDYGRELAMCQRYYQQWGGNTGNERLATGFNYSTTQMRIDIPLVVTMRATPTLTVSAASDWAVEGPVVQTCTSINLDQASPRIAATNFNVVSGLTSGQGGHIMANGTTNARFNLSSEL